MTEEPRHEARPALAPSIAGAQGRQAARQRLRTAQGHLDAVRRMLDSDRYGAPASRSEIRAVP